MKHRECKNCGSSKYYCKGLCKSCYTKQLVPSRWSRESDFCKACKSSDSPHVAHGLCQRCFNTEKDAGNLCECGCGLPTSRRRGMETKFRKGHWLRVQGKGSPFQEAHKDRFTGKNNPQYGKFGKNHPSYGHETSQETREFRRQVAVKRIVNQKKTGTDIEKILSEILDEIGIRHIPQYPFKGKFVVDEFLPDHNIIIEANGDYWHGNPSLFPKPNKMQKENMGRDKGRFMYIHKCGYIPLFLWGNELLKHKELCNHRIVQLVKNTLLPLGENSV